MFLVGVLGVSCGVLVGTLARIRSYISIFCGNRNRPEPSALDGIDAIAQRDGKRGPVAEVMLARGRSYTSPWPKLYPWQTTGTSNFALTRGRSYAGPWPKLGTWEKLGTRQILES